MANVQDSLSFHRAALRGSCAVEARIHVGGDYVDVPATIGQTPIGFDHGNGVIQTWQSTDFLVQAADLVIADQEITPHVGMWIACTLNGRSVEFNVLEADNGRCFQWSGPGRTTFRIHAKER